MADAENETHSGDLPVLQPLPLIYFANERACYCQKQQEHHKRIRKKLKAFI